MEPHLEGISICELWSPGRWNFDTPCMNCALSVVASGGIIMKQTPWNSEFSHITGVPQLFHKVPFFRRYGPMFRNVTAAGIRGPVGQDEMASTKSTKTALSDKEQSKAADVASMLGTTARHRPPEPFCHGGSRE